MKIILFFILMLSPLYLYALEAGDFSELEGYTVAAVTRIDGDFEGCDYDKVIKLLNGWSLTCNTYHYHYGYSPEIAVLTRDIGKGYSVKAVIDDYIYDLKPVLKH